MKVKHTKTMLYRYSFQCANLHIII